MRDVPSIDAPCGYVLTESAWSDLDDESCDCVDLLVIDGTTRCRVCGTCFGVVMGYYRPPRRRTRASRRAS